MGVLVPEKADLGGAPPRNDKAQGAVPTPPEIAADLVQWAIRSPEDVVLDAGAGEGVFTIEAVRRLRELGAETEDICRNVYAVDEDASSLSVLEQSLKKEGIPRVNLLRESLFDIGSGLFGPTLPRMDAVIGNPPYVRRWWLRPDVLRLMDHANLPRLTDLACHFAMHAAGFLGESGRLAMIITDSWLDTRYGRPFKKFLLEHFRICSIVGFADRVFDGVLVRPVLLKAERNRRADQELTSFAVLASRPPTIEPKRGHRPPRIFRIRQSALSADSSWSTWLYAPPAYFRIAGHKGFVPLSALASSRIGFQSFARDFFILSADRAREMGLKREYLTSYVYSPRDCPEHYLLRRSDARQHLFTCNTPIEDVRDEIVRRYIQWGEGLKYKPRGAAAEVLGVHRRPRIARASREPWYNVKDEIGERGGCPILVPRRQYVRYRVWLNQDLVPASENFIEIKPRQGIDSRLLVAVLASSFGELNLRVQAHQYGGGVFDLSPGSVSGIRVPDVRAFPPSSRVRLLEALSTYQTTGEREEIDEALAAVLDIPSDLLRRVRSACAELRRSARRVSGRIQSAG
ncbi:MAG: N-6 DNA methylase [Acidobacteriota bacterium]